MALKFETNVVNELTMRSLTGELVVSQYGGQQYRFITDAGAFYVSESAGAILHERFVKLGVTAGEPIEICKREVNRGGRKSIQWEVARVGVAPGEQPDGTFAIGAPPETPSILERQLAASLAEVAARKSPARAAGPSAVPAASPAAMWQQTLLAQTNALTDVFAAALQHASEQHGNAIKADDIRSLMLSAFINLAKGGNSRAA